MTICDDPVKRNTHYTNSYRKALIEKIDALEGSVFRRNDLKAPQPNKDQLRLNRALKAFMDDGIIIKIGHNLYAKAKQIEIRPGKTEIIAEKSFEAIAIEALNKLNLEWEFNQAIQDYNDGKTQQIPVLFSVRLHSRFRGSIRINGKKLEIEGAINAR